MSRDVPGVEETAPSGWMTIGWKGPGQSPFLLTELFVGWGWGGGALGTERLIRGL